MSIATDVSRIKGNITAALAAIADKGVIVPDGSTSDALAGLIASIEAGGVDLGDYFTDIFIGTLTPAEDIKCGDACSAVGLSFDKMIVIVANNEFRQTIDGNHIRYAVWPWWCYEGIWRVLYGKGTSSYEEGWATLSSFNGGSTYLLAAGIRYGIFALNGQF